MDFIRVRAYINCDIFNEPKLFYGRNILIPCQGTFKKDLNKSSISFKNDRDFEFLDSATITFNDFSSFYEFAKNNCHFSCRERKSFFKKRPIRKVKFFIDEVVDVQWVIFEKGFKPVSITFEFFRRNVSVKDAMDEMTIEEFYSYCQERGMSFGLLTTKQKYVKIK